MLALVEILVSSFQYCHSWISKLTEPNPKHTEDKVQREIAHTRNKILVFVQIALCFFFLGDMVINNTHLSVTMVRILTNIFVCITLFISARYNPNIFGIMYTFIGVIYGPCTMDKGEEGLHVAWFATLYLPAFVYVFTGSLRYTLVQTFCQILYANTVYKQRMRTAIVFMNPVEFERAFLEATNAAFAFHLILVIFSHLLMQHAIKTISTVEKKKNEAENQKNFLLGFSHELRNLINSLTGNIKLATLETLTPKAKELMLNAEVCGELLLHLVNNILDTGKVEIGELEINPVPTRIYETLERIWGVCSELIKRKSLLGKLTVPKDLPKNLMIDHYRLTQIFLNLVGNAVKFTETGSIYIDVIWLKNKHSIDEECFEPYPFNNSDVFEEGLFEKSKNMSNLDQNIINLDVSSRQINKKLLRPSTDAQKGILKIVITDTGCGMSEQEIDKLFQKFSQVTSDTSKRKLGTGLGLFITKQLCHRMHGCIRVFSQKDHGTSFIFCIPTEGVLQESRHLQSSESIKEFVMSQKLKAMIVDDVVFNHGILKSFFDKLGIEVVDIASNGEEAYQNYLKHIERGDRPHVVTMDLEMPVMDGKEAAKKIRKLEKEKMLEPCCLVIVSGNCTESEIRECMNKEGEIKANAFIKKPATIEEILRVIADHFISSSKSRRESRIC